MLLLTGALNYSMFRIFWFSHDSSTWAVSGEISSNSLSSLSEVVAWQFPTLCRSAGGFGAESKRGGVGAVDIIIGFGLMTFF